MTGLYQIVPLATHASNLDRTAKLVSSPRYEGRDIYRVTGGYLACVGNSDCLAGLFTSEDEARQAVDIALSVPNSL